MFSLNKGRPIAKIVGGKLNGKILYIYDSDKFQESSDSDDDDLSLLGKDVKLKTGKFEQLPNIDTREVSYIAGPSGSGKSTYASNYIEKFKKIFPEGNVYVFSRLNSDPALDSLGVIRIMLDESIYQDPIDIQTEIPDYSLVLFDDTDTIQDKKIAQAVSKLKNDILETGRHKNIYTLVTSHLVNGNDRKDTRTIMNEMHTLTVFPKSGAAHAIDYALKNYFGLPKNVIKDVLGSDSRWVTLFKNYPNIIMSDKRAYIPS
jgi:hypothetical protein